MGVRVDREGILTYDFHTAQNVLKASGELKETELSRRYYLADASFIVGLYGEEALLHRLHEALHKPIWPLFLGRKAFVPGEPIWLADGLHSGAALRATLTTYPWLARPGQHPPKRLRLVLEDPEGSEMRSDQPVSFQTDARRYAPRRVQTDWVFLSQ
jgi:CRISPR system Cascade subunit CasD